MWGSPKSVPVREPPGPGSAVSGVHSTEPCDALSGDDAVANDRRKRQLKILEMIETRALRTQEEVADALASEGWEVTQSSVSRDIAALGLVKASGAYRRPEIRVMNPDDPDERRIAEGVLRAEPAGDSLVVLHTPPGEASRVGAALDRLAWGEIVGTIAGDDTIFLATHGRVPQRRLLRLLGRLVRTG